MFDWMFLKLVDQLFFINVLSVYRYCSAEDGNSVKYLPENLPYHIQLLKGMAARTHRRGQGAET
jgi:hypothetical protein